MVQQTQYGSLLLCSDTSCGYFGIIAVHCSRACDSPLLVTAQELAHLVFAATRFLIAPQPVKITFLDAVVRSTLRLLHLDFLLYIALIVAAAAIEYRQQLRARELQAAQLERQLAQAHIIALRMQLNPHFLFNTLNSVAMLVREYDNARAVRMLTRLGDLLRYVLTGVVTQEVLLREELEFVQRYLDIESVRFEDRLRVQIEVAPGLYDAMVPNLILQPLVENAIRHGIARKGTADRLCITATTDRDRLVRSVEDDGPGLSREPVEQGEDGVGLQNTETRLHRLYGTQGQLNVSAAEEGGVRATVSLPLKHGIEIQSKEAPS